MNKIVCLLTLMCASLFGDIQFSSKEVTTNGNEVVLKGNVFIKHNLGTISANEATLTQGTNSNEPSLMSACLKSCVEIQFSSNQTLHSENATIDFAHHTASLSSDDKQIFFFDPDKKITIQSKDLDCTWEDDHRNPRLISLLANNSVQISFGTDMFLHAENAEYCPNDEENGFLKLGSSRSEKPCLISIGDDLLKAESVTIDVENESMILHRPIGRIATAFVEKALPEEISFTSKNLLLNRKTGEISLSEQILVDAASFGHLISDDTVTFSTEKVDEKILFKGFSTQGRSYLTTDQGMKISCDGQIDFDYIGKKLTADGHETPILYQNGNLVIEARKVTLDKLQGTPKLISFYDQVNFSAGDMIGNAGSLNYRPTEHTLEFFSSEKENVVFYNKESDTKMCADGITITRDPDTQENVIHGHGIVKLTFDHKNREQIIEVLNSCVKHPF